MPQQLIASEAAVAAGHPHGASAGLAMLRAGGNAIDAAVAGMLALCVVTPGSVGLGGYGGSAVIYLARRSERGTRTGEPAEVQRAKGQVGRVVAVDFDSCAPLAFRDGLVTADRQSSHYGARAVTVPAVVAGLGMVLREFGTKAWREVLQPALRLAEDGFAFDTEHQRHFDRCAAHFDRQSLNSLFPNGIVPQVGERWQQPGLGRLLRRLADDGPEAFYEGEIARSIIRYLGERGGILAEEDFRSYRPRLVEAIHVRYRGDELYSPPPPSGGTTSLAIVQTADLLKLDRLESGSARYYHLLSETMKQCWQERHQYLGDPEFVRPFSGDLLSIRAAAARAKRIQSGAVMHAGPARPASPHTSNVVAADAEGNLISLTATQGWMYGSHLVVDGLGLVLNHGMSRFEYEPGHPNAPAAGKRMQHNMAPMIGLREGRPRLALGMPGGPKIVSVTAQLVWELLAFGATPAAAIAAPRVHTEGGEPLLVSTHMPSTIVTELERLGHAVRKEDDMGGPVNVLAVHEAAGKIDIASGEGTGAVAGI
jgi:gamma-glutamyltranspeptidase/glutathione hydrolase